MEEDVFFSILFYVFLWFKPVTIGEHHFGPWDYYLNKLEDYKAMPQSKFQADEHSSSCENFKYILLLNSNSCHRAGLDPGASIFTNLVEEYQALVLTKLKRLRQVVLKIFKYFSIYTVIRPPSQDPWSRAIRDPRAPFE